MVIWRRISMKKLRRLVQEVPVRLRWQWVSDAKGLVLKSPRGRPWALCWRRMPPGWYLAPLEDSLR